MQLISIQTSLARKQQTRWLPFCTASYPAAGNVPGLLHLSPAASPARLSWGRSCTCKSRVFSHCGTSTAPGLQHQWWAPGSILACCMLYFKQPGGSKGKNVPHVEVWGGEGGGEGTLETGSLVAGAKYGAACEGRPRWQSSQGSNMCSLHFINMYTWILNEILTHGTTWIGPFVFPERIESPVFPLQKWALLSSHKQQGNVSNPNSCVKTKYKMMIGSHVTQRSGMCSPPQISMPLVNWDAAHPATARAPPGAPGLPHPRAAHTYLCSPQAQTCDSSTHHHTYSSSRELFWWELNSFCLVSLALLMASPKPAVRALPQPTGSLHYPSPGHWEAVALRWCCTGIYAPTSCSQARPAPEREQQ